MNRYFAFLMLVFLVSACTTTTPVPPPVDTLSNTPPPALTATGTPMPSAQATGPYLAYSGKEGDQNAVVFLNADGKGRKLIPYPADTSTQAGLPSLRSALSPDGQWLAYYTGSAGPCFGNSQANSADLALNLLSLAEGKSQVVTSLLSHDYPNNFVQAAQQLHQTDITADQLKNAFVCGITQSIAWSPDGRLLAFAGQMDGLSSDMYISDPAKGSIKRLSSGPGEMQKIAWSPDGRWILAWSSYWVGEGMTYSVYATSLDGAVVNKLITNNCGNLDWLYSTTYSFSDCAMGVGTYNLSLVNVETGKVTKVWDGEFSSVAVSADHQWLAYYSHISSQIILKTGSDLNFVPGLYLVNLITLKSSRVELPGNFEDYQSLQALGSGNRTFGLLNTSRNNLYFLSPDGKLSSAGVNATLFSLSPDRQSLVAIGQTIHVLKADGTSIRDVDLPANLTTHGIRKIIWRPDSSGLFFTYQDPRNYNSAVQLYVMDLLTGSAEQVDTLSPGDPADFVWVSGPK
jgi:roadblock/LC7 domain-containing protein